MRAEEIREMAPADIASRLAELEEERFRLRFRGATETLEDPLRLRVIRKDIARVKTVQREQVLSGGAAKSPARKSATKKSAAKKKSTPKAKTTTRRAAKAGARR